MPSPSFNSLIAEKLAGLGADLAEACEKLSIERESRLRDENKDLQAELEQLRSRLESSNSSDGNDVLSLSLEKLPASPQPPITDNAQTSEARKSRICSCGSRFVLDAEFCGKCGRRRLPKHLEADPAYVHHEFSELLAKSGFEEEVLNSEHVSVDAIDLGYSERKEPTLPAEVDTFMLDPSSTMRLVWDIFGIPILSWDLITIPLQVFDAGQTVEDILSYADWVTLLYWSCDIPFTFLTGFYDSEGNVIMSFRRTALHYARGPLLLDILIIAADWTSQMIELVSSAEAPSVMSNMAILRVLRISRFARLVRLRKLKGKLQTIEDSVNNEWYLILVNLLVKVFGVLVINHYIGCGWYYLGNADWTAPDSHRWLTIFPYPQYGVVSRPRMSDAPFAYTYLTCLHWAIAQFTPAPQNIQAQNAWERLYTIFVLLFGMVIFSSFIAAVTQARLQMTKMMSKFERDFWLLRKFCRQNNVSAKLQSRMKRYIDFVVVPAQAKLTLADISLVHQLSRDLREQLNTEIFSQCLCVHPMLAIVKKNHQSVMHHQCTLAVNTLPLAKGDVAYVGGQQGNVMIFVSAGFLDYIPMVQQYDERHMKPGEWASEAVLWTQWIYQGQLQASVESKTLTLDGEIFRKVLMHNGLVMPFARRYGREFVKNLNKVYRETGMPSDLYTRFAFDFFMRHTKSLQEGFLEASKVPEDEIYVPNR